MTSMLTDLLRRRSAVLLLGIIVLGALLRFYAIGAKTMWLDEAFSIWVADRGVVGGWQWLVRIDQHPPLYYSLLSLWQSLFGDEQGVVRMFSALCSTATIPFLYLAARRITRDELTALLAAFILAVSPFHVRFAQEARMYALLTLLAAIAVYCAALYLGGYGTRRLTWRDFLYPRRWARLHDVRAAVGLVLAQAGLMLTHNTATVFFPLALNLAVLGAWSAARVGKRYVDIRAVNSPRFLSNWLKIQGAAFLLWLPWAIPFVIQARLVDREFWIPAPTLRTVAGALKTFSFAHLPDWLPAAPLVIFYVALVFLGLYFLRKRPAWALFLLSLLVVPFVGELLVSLRRPIFYDRTLIWTTLPMYMLMAVGIRGLMVGYFSPNKAELFPVAEAMGDQRGKKLARRGLGLAVVGIIALVSMAALVNYYRFFEKEEWADAAGHVAAQVAPGDMILFNASWVQIPFDYYYRHFGLDTDRHGAPVDLFDAGVLEPAMTEADVARLQALLADRERVWLVYSHNWYTDPDSIVPRELARVMEEQAKEEFAGLQVILYAR